ncbi:MAG: hypothetical protein AAFX62_04515 [Pseudomonadota bacterium]
MTPRAKDFGLPEPTPEDQTFWAPHLRTGETLLWAGRPPQSTLPMGFFQMIYAALGVVSICWAVYMIIHASDGRSVEPNAQRLLALPYLLVGWWLVWGQSRQDLRVRRAIWYALTDSRALELNRDKFNEVTLAPRLEIEARLSRGPAPVRFGPRPNLLQYDPIGIAGRDVLSLMGWTVIGHWYIGGHLVFWEIPKPRAVRDLARAVRDAA